MNFETKSNDVRKCSTLEILAVNDTINVVVGKWKLPIIGVLLFGKKRFNEIEREIPKITPRMLSKELKDLEANGMVKRTSFNAVPVVVEYELTKSGDSFSIVLDALMEWGLKHRQNVLDHTDIAGESSAV